MAPTMDFKGYLHHLTRICRKWPSIENWAAAVSTSINLSRRKCMSAGKQENRCFQMVFNTGWQNTTHIGIHDVILWSQEWCWISKNMCRLTSILAHYSRKITKYFHARFRQFGDDDKRGSVVMLMSAPCHPHVNYITSQPAPYSTLFHQILLNSTTF